jgi:hypothetical protein
MSTLEKYWEAQRHIDELYEDLHSTADEVYKEYEKYFNGLKDEDFTEHCEVNNPMHYTVGGYEALEVIRAKLTPEEWKGAMKFNVLKYLMRANYKGHHDKDVQKADFYMCELADAINDVSE